MTKPLPLPSPSVVSEKLSPMEPRALTVRVRVRVRVRRAKYPHPNPIPTPPPIRTITPGSFGHKTGLSSCPRCAAGKASDKRGATSSATCVACTGTPNPNPNPRPKVWSPTAPNLHTVAVSVGGAP